MHAGVGFSLWALGLGALLALVALGVCKQWAHVGLRRRALCVFVFVCVIVRV